MKILALNSIIFVLIAAHAVAQQSDIEFLRARADAHEQKISQLERELNELKAQYAKKKHPKAVPVAAGSSAKSGEYIVKLGDMLGRIANRHNTTVAAIKKANGLINDNIRIGQKLNIPGAEDTLHAEPVSQTPQVQKNDAPKSPLTHVVKSGETFYSIARQHNVSISHLMKANPNVRATSMRVGQQLSIMTGGRMAAKMDGKSVARGTASKPKSLPKPKGNTNMAKHNDLPKPKFTAAKDLARNAPASRKSVSEPAIRTVTVHKQITYGQLASKHGASTSQLNELNGLSLSKSTMLAIGSELYVPKD
ncbi:MAG: LysM peptidoglycan-binding domain-containing protein [Akkermansiaceae bacterium]|nr:LysM peptidoglycan-binding domain-containing protein [Akkermansiaceae bacterium]